MIDSQLIGNAAQNLVTAEFVSAAFHSAGLTPTEQADKIAALLNSQLTALSPLLEHVSFHSEAGDFLSALVEEAQR